MLVYHEIMVTLKMTRDNHSNRNAMINAIELLGKKYLPVWWWIWCRLKISILDFPFTKCETFNWNVIYLVDWWQTEWTESMYVIGDRWQKDSWKWVDGDWFTSICVKNLQIMQHQLQNKQPRIVYT